MRTHAIGLSCTREKTIGGFCVISVYRIPRRYCPAVAANLFAAGADFVLNSQIAINMDRVGVPHSWMIPLGILKAAGALGLLIGIFVPSIGIAAAVGLVLFFVGAIITHLRGTTTRSLRRSSSSRCLWPRLC